MLVVWVFSDLSCWLFRVLEVWAVGGLASRLLFFYVDLGCWLFGFPVWVVG